MENISIQQNLSYAYIKSKQSCAGKAGNLFTYMSLLLRLMSKCNLISV